MKFLPNIVDRGAWIVRARYSDGASAFYNRFATEAEAEAWAQEQRDCSIPGCVRYTFTVEERPTQREVSK